MFSVLLVVLACANSDGADFVRANDVVWTAPSRDENGAMPIGNGDFAASVWIDASGTLSLYLAKSDAWDDNARLLKLGRLRLRLDPNPLSETAAYQQRLNLRDGEIEIAIGEGDEAVTLRVRVDANHPVCVIDVTGAQATSMRVELDHWRTAPRPIKEVTWSDVYCVDWGKPPKFPMVTEPDTIVPAALVTDDGAGGDELIWYHRNERTPIPATFELQALQPLLATFVDPILHRMFGCRVVGTNLERASETSLRSKEPSTTHRVYVWALTRADDTPPEFEAALRRLPHGAPSDATMLTAHRAWWSAFWRRSWIHLRDNGTVAPYPLVNNALPVTVGADVDGGNEFRGTIEQLLVLGRALDESSIAALGSTPDAAPSDTILTWRDGDDRTIADAPSLDARGGLTICAWIDPDRQDESGGRIIDKCPIGTTDGWMLDTYPSNSLRFIAGEMPLTFDARLEPHKRVFVAATYDPRTAQRRLFIDGKKIAESAALEPPAMAIERAYVLQRYLTACAGRGAMPIKFNGSLFTVARAGHDDGDPDFRRWGPGYWFQNTRLIYWPLFASGDIDLADPFFRMYRDALPLAQKTHELLYRERLAPGAATFPETIYFWGTPDNSSFGWDRTGANPGEVTNPYIRRYRSGSIELLLMAIERYEYTHDREFLRETVIPLAHAVGAFYSSFYPRDANGFIRFEPAAALETWHDATNPLPEIAGLRDVVARLARVDPVELEAVDPDFAVKLKRLAAALPPLPMEDFGEGPVLLPAERFDQLANVENPELYAVFPYRLFGVGKADVAIAQRTFDKRRNRSDVGWCQDSIHAAFLGRVEEAAGMLARRAVTKDQKSRFPAFWGPNFDWVPDQDHGSNIVMTLQTMLMQCDGRLILLMPAWPRGWDCDFKLHAPGNTVIEGAIRNGHMVLLDVTPVERASDVEIWNR